MASYVSVAAAAPPPPRRPARAPPKQPGRPIVRVFLKENGIESFVATVLREKLEKHSFAFRAFFAWEERPDEQVREVVLPEGFAHFLALQIVLRSIASYEERRGGHLIRLNTNLTTSERCQIWDVTRKLRVEPETAEESIRSQLSWRVSHNLATPEDVVAVYQIFKPFEFREHDVYRPMVHQYVWNLQHGDFDDATVTSIEQAIANHQDLDDDVQEKYDQLLPGLQTHLRHKAGNARRSQRGRNRRAGRQ